MYLYINDWIKKNVKIHVLGWFSLRFEKLV